MPGVDDGHHGRVQVPRIGGDERDPSDRSAQPRPTNGFHSADPAARSDDHILETKSVTYAYQDGTVALRDLTIAFPRNRRAAILGANGSGKSTLFLTLNGILKPASGRVLLADQPVRYDRAGLNDLRRRVGLVFQDPDSQLFAASVRQDISFGPINLGLSDTEVRARVGRAIADAQIEDLADRPTHLLSYGQKKRVAIAGVLAMDPEVIVADEPTAGLDPEMTARLLDLLNRLHDSGRTIVISTHDLDLALAWADEAFVLLRGELLMQGRPEDILADAEQLRDARLRPPIILDTFARLRAAGAVSPDAPAPRTAADLASLVTSERTR